MKEEEKLLTHMSELDRVLGGGIVPGSLTLVGGDPGIGRNVFIIHSLDGINDHHLRFHLLYRLFYQGKIRSGR